MVFQRNQTGIKKPPSDIEALLDRNVDAIGKCDQIVFAVAITEKIQNWLCVGGNFLPLQVGIEIVDSQPWLTDGRYLVRSVDLQRRDDLTINFKATTQTFR